MHQTLLAAFLVVGVACGGPNDHSVIVAPTSPGPGVAFLRIEPGEPTLGPAPDLVALVALTTALDLVVEPEDIVVADSDAGGAVRVAAVPSGEDYLRLAYRLAVELPQGWAALTTIGYSLEDRPGSAFVRLGAAKLGTFDRAGRRAPFLLVAVERGESISRGCDRPDQHAERVYFLCALGGEPRCFATLVAGAIAYDADNLLPSPAEARGECDDYQAADEPPPRGPGPAELTEVAITAHDTVTITRGGSRRAVSVGRIYDAKP